MELAEVQSRWNAIRDDETFAMVVSTQPLKYPTRMGGERGRGLYAQEISTRIRRRY